MGRMKELSLVLDELSRCGESLIQISTDLKEIFSAPAEPEPEKDNKAKEPKKEADPAPEKKLMKLEDVRAILAEKSRDGYTNGIKALLKKHGGDKLSEVPPEEYEALLQEVEVLDHD
ncbi:MAG: hypothetical protein K5739_08110 [Lachnospiraceae bacterium]|nr:hypothetical protein [Lachnospiraceae bacterium]